MTTLEQSWSVQEVCDAWGQSPDYIRKLIREGKVGFIRAGRTRRFLAEHIAQLREHIEVKPMPPPVRIMTRRSVPRRKRSA